MKNYRLDNDATFERIETNDAAVMAKYLYSWTDDYGVENLHLYIAGEEIDIEVEPDLEPDTEPNFDLGCPADLTGFCPYGSCEICPYA